MKYTSTLANLFLATMLSTALLSCKKTDSEKEVAKANQNIEETVKSAEDKSQSTIQSAEQAIKNAEQAVKEAQEIAKQAEITIAKNSLKMDSLLGENYVVYDQVGSSSIYKTNLREDGSGTMLTEQGLKNITWTLDNEVLKIQFNEFATDNMLIRTGYITIEDKNGKKVQVEQVCRYDKIEMKVINSLESIEFAVCTTEDLPRYDLPSQTTNEVYKNKTIISRGLKKFSNIGKGTKLVLPLQDYGDSVEVTLDTSNTGTVNESFTNPDLKNFSYSIKADMSELKISFFTGKTLSYRLINHSAEQMILSVTEIENYKETNIIGLNGTVVNYEKETDMTSFAGIYKPILNNQVAEDSSLDFSLDGLATLDFGNDLPIQYYKWTVEKNVAVLTSYVPKTNVVGENSLYPSKETLLKCVSKEIECVTKRIRTFKIVRSVDDTLVIQRTLSSFKPDGTLFEDAGFANLFSYKKVK